MKKVRDLFIDESGQGMVEYALILTLIAVALVAALKLFGDNIFSSFRKSGEQFDNIK